MRGQQHDRSAAHSTHQGYMKKVAVAAVKAGATEEKFVSQFQEQFREMARRAWQEAAAKVRA